MDTSPPQIKWKIPKNYLRDLFTKLNFDEDTASMDTFVPPRNFPYPSLLDRHVRGVHEKKTVLAVNIAVISAQKIIQ